MGTPTRFNYGLATVTNAEPLGNYPLPDPFHTSSSPNKGLGVVQYANDFDTLIGTDYTVTGTSSTFSLSTTVVGGAAVLTPGGVSTASSAYKAGQFLQFQAGNKLWFLSRFQVSSVTAPTAYVGLQAGSATTDGLWFSMAAGGVISLVSTVGSTATTLVSTVTTATSAAWVDVGFYFNGTELDVFVNDVMSFRVAVPTIGSSATTLTNAILTPVFEITPTATQTLTVDYVLAAQEVTR